jgi:hypothetical protein
MFAPNDSVMDLLLTVAAALERMTVANETGGTANIDWEWAVDEDGCLTGDETQKDGGSK